MELKVQGNRCGSNILKDISGTQDRTHDCKKGVERLNDNQKSHISAEKVLLMFVGANLTKTQYEIIRETVGNLPCYSIIQQQKKKCYPPKETFHVTESCVEVNLQAIIDHTT